MACQKKKDTSIAFYYWKTSLDLQQKDETLLKETSAGKIYLRLFDIRWNEVKGLALPAGVIKFKQKLPNLAVVPVVYITNKSLSRLGTKGVDSLATNTFRLLHNIMTNHRISYEFIQIDCDWTEGTREKYFRYLKRLKLISKKQLEATIRLHQVKYKERTGVPPVEKGVLMFYNMGKLNGDLNTPNSIYNKDDASKYTSFISSYPLQLDVALPLFSWLIQVRDSKILGLYSQLTSDELINTGGFSVHPNFLVAKKSFFFKGIYVKEKDIFKLEETNGEILQQAAEQLSSALPQNNKRTIIFYELGNLNHSTFKAKTLNEISSQF
ncbi:hypothetical protein [Desertivirga brevis]|uniref:hypothetical protein n=1 Tax=Desertivirga brevis TaxID=2810310 RepID=UPI001A97A4A2|nr:hypothetical protein [Pedobacter sp. SYSU D00873]